METDMNEESMNFLLNARLLGVSLDEEVESAIKRFGKPSHREPARKSYPEFLVYGSLEVQAVDGRINSMRIKLIENSESPQFVIHLVDDLRSISQSDIELLFVRNRTPWRVNPIFTDDSQTTLETQNACFVFDEEHKLVIVAVYHVFDFPTDRDGSQHKSS